MSSRPDCIFEIHQLCQSGFSGVNTNCCCRCSFEAEIIKIGQLSHKMYSNNIVNFQESTTILNAWTKKSGNILKAPRNHLSKMTYFEANYWILNSFHFGYLVDEVKHHTTLYYVTRLAGSNKRYLLISVAAFGGIEQYRGFKRQFFCWENRGPGKRKYFKNCNVIPLLEQKIMRHKNIFGSFFVSTDVSALKLI